MKLYEPEDYQSTVEADFDQVASEIAPLLPWAEIQHVGSSAIPGAISKGDLDILVRVPEAAHAESVAVLEHAGYRIKVDTLRTPDLCMLESPVDGRDIALQVVAQGSEFDFFVDFRDALRRRPSWWPPTTT